MKYKFIDTCFGTHHPQFGYDADNTLWMSGTGPVAGWINTKVFDETGDAQKAVGWFPFVLDTNGNGKLDEFAEPGKPEAGKDMRFNPGSGPYAVMPHPNDGSIWYTSGVFGGTAGLPALRSEDQAQRVLRGAEGSDRPARRRHRRGRRALGLRLGRPSDRASTARKCKAPLNGPNATGNHCPEGFTLHKYPGPGFDDVPNSQRRGELLHLGRSSQRGRPRRRTFRSRPPTCRTASSAWSRTARWS